MHHVATPASRRKAMKDQSRQCYTEAPGQVGPLGSHVFQVHSKAEQSVFRHLAPKPVALSVATGLWKKPVELLESK